MTVDQFIKYLSLLPTLLGLINQVEGLFGHLPGAAKQAIVTGTVQAAADANGTPLLPVHTEVLTNTVNGIVKNLNDLEVFAHKPKPTT